MTLSASSSGEESECTDEEEEEEEEGSEATVYYSPSLAVVFGSEDATAPPPPSFPPPLSDAVALQIEVESTSDADMTTGEATQHPTHSDGEGLYYAVTEMCSCGKGGHNACTLLVGGFFSAIFQFWSKFLLI